MCIVQAMMQGLPISCCFALLSTTKTAIGHRPSATAADGDGDGRTGPIRIEMNMLNVSRRRKSRQLTCIISDEAVGEAEDGQEGHEEQSGHRLHVVPAGNARELSLQ